MRRRALTAVAALLLGAGPAVAQTTPTTPALPAVPSASGLGRPAIACGPGNAGPACREIRRALRSPEPTAPRLLSPQPAPQFYAPPPSADDVRGARFIPPNIEALLRDRRIDPTVRAYLRGMAAKPTEDWSLADLQRVSAIVPTLTEMQNPIATARISEFYEFLGLDPTQLFEPQLGNWQGNSTAFDPRNFAPSTADCPTSFQRRQADPADLKLKELAGCPSTSYGRFR